MTEKKIKLPHHIAEKICEVECVSQSEGIGPDMSELLLWIGETYPDLKEKYSYLEWPGKCSWDAEPSKEFSEDLRKYKCMNENLKEKFS